MTRREAHDHFRKRLADFQKNREDRPAGVPVTIRGRTYLEPAWAVFEVESMHDTINRLRASNGQPGITMDDVWTAEGLAKGHSDYSIKFALYCAELALYGRVQ